MAFDYNELNRIKGKIATDSEEIKQVLNNLNSLVENNVGQVSTWSSSKATEFKTKWTDFASEKFPTYEQSFTKQVNILDTAIRSYREAEGETGATSSRSTSFRQSNSNNTNPYDRQVEKMSEKAPPTQIVNKENAGIAIQTNFQDNKNLTNMVNKKIYESFKATINGKINE